MTSETKRRPAATDDGETDRPPEKIIGLGERIVTCSTTTTITSPRKPKVKFRGVNVRIFARLLGDNPAAAHGPPLGLDWLYVDLTRDDDHDYETDAVTTTSKGGDDEDDVETETIPESSDSEIDPSLSEGLDGAEEDTRGGGDERERDRTLFPIDDYEREASRRRRSRLLQVRELREKSETQYRAMQRTLQRQASTGNLYFKDPEAANATTEKEKEESGLLTEEEMNQLTAKWLKIQPVSGKLREKILLQQTQTTKNEIEARKKELFKLRSQRKSTVAMAETGLDDWRIVGEFLKRRFRRFKTGISKQREQDLLWEQAREYFARKNHHRQQQQQQEEQRERGELPVED